ncbi:hypothetical protein CBS76997_4834 [Aspergillus niger]|nr:hypothetical protein CBS13152_3343 [Aspergillus niger]KAI3044754.1 hypothetical protein CBS76997_4834 [Aspergillus niger]KAI3077843.1 hypothetical protein CBS147353_4306 [Aspergillus niger]
MGSPQDIEQALLGSWSLLDYRSQLQDGSETFPMGEGARGIINFNPNGRMSVQLQPAVTKKVKETVHDLLAYTGRYWVETQPDGSVMLKHHLEVCSWPEGDGSYQLRTVVLSEDQLVLSSPAPLNVELSIFPNLDPVGTRFMATVPTERALLRQWISMANNENVDPVLPLL